jgi:hypothetical protein
MSIEASEGGIGEPDDPSRAQELKKFTPAGRGFWKSTPDAEWNDWRWQLRNRIISLEQLELLMPTLTPEERAGALLATNFTAHPARPDPVHGQIQGSQFVQYDFTPQQYESLAHLVATLCRILPKIECKFPAEANGRPVMGRLPDDDLANFHGILGHYHLDASKVDPGPAFNWERVITEARRILYPSIPATPAAKHLK